MKAKALLKIADRLDRETNFARGLLAAVHGLECMNEDLHEGAAALATAHIKRLGKISAELMRASRKQAP